MFLNSQKFGGKRERGEGGEGGLVLGERAGRRGAGRGRGKREGNGEWDDMDIAMARDIAIVIDIIQPTQALGFQDDCNLNIQVTSYMCVFFFVPLFCIALHCARCACT